MLIISCSVALNDVKEGDAQPDVQDFVDVLLHMAKTDTNITRETISLLCLYVIARPSGILYYLLPYSICQLSLCMN